MTDKQYQELKENQMLILKSLQLIRESQRMMVLGDEIYHWGEVDKVLEDRQSEDFE